MMGPGIAASRTVSHFYHSSTGKIRVTFGVRTVPRRPQLAHQTTRDAHLPRPPQRAQLEDRKGQRYRWCGLRRALQRLGRVRADVLGHGRRRQKEGAYHGRQSARKSPISPAESLVAVARSAREDPMDRRTGRSVQTGGALDEEQQGPRPQTGASGLLRSRHVPSSVALPVSCFCNSDDFQQGGKFARWRPLSRRRPKRVHASSGGLCSRTAPFNRSSSGYVSAHPCFGSAGSQFAKPQRIGTAAPMLSAEHTLWLVVVRGFALA